MGNETMDRFIRKQEYLLGAEEIKKNMTPEECEAFDFGVLWLARYMDELVKGIDNTQVM